MYAGYRLSGIFKCIAHRETQRRACLYSYWFLAREHGGTVPGSLARQRQALASSWLQLSLTLCMFEPYPLTVWIRLWFFTQVKISDSRSLLGYSTLPSPVQFTYHLISPLLILKLDNLEFVFLPLQSMISCESFPFYYSIPYAASILITYTDYSYVIDISKIQGNQISPWTVLGKIFLDLRYNELY